MISSFVYSEQQQNDKGKVKKVKSATCYSASYMRRTHGQKRCYNVGIDWMIDMS